MLHIVIDDGAKPGEVVVREIKCAGRTSEIVAHLVFSLNTIYRAQYHNNREAAEELKAAILVGLLSDICWDPELSPVIGMGAKAYAVAVKERKNDAKNDSGASGCGTGTYTDCVPGG